MSHHYIPKTIHSITEMPEIMAIISSFLITTDIANCILTCKSFQRDFTPFLWENITLRVAPSRSNAIRQNLHLIQRINITDNKLSFLQILTKHLPPIASLSQDDYKPVPKTTTTSYCTNLLYLELLPSLERSNYLTHVTTLLHYNTNITALEFSIENKDFNWGLLDFLKTIPSLRQLRRFRCTSTSIPFKPALSLIQITLSLPQLSEIYYNMTVSIAEEDELITNDVGTVIKEAMEARSQYREQQATTGIKSLQIPEAKHIYTFLVPFLELGILNLDSLEIPWTAFTNTQVTLIRNHCPNIRRLSFQKSTHLLYHGQFNKYDAPGIVGSAYAFILGCTGLKSFLLRGIDLDLMPMPTINMLSSLKGGHQETIESFGFIHCGGDSYEILRSAIQFLFHCRNLKRYCIIPTVTKNRGLLAKDLVAEEWICHGLRELSLVLQKGSQVIDGGRQTRSKSELPIIVDTVSLKELFTRINKLENLEVLALKEDESNLSKECMEEWSKALSENFLRLSNMKRLRHFHMLSDFSSWMGEEHVKFMDQHWPMLQTINFSVPHRGWFQRFIIEARPYWQWLKEKRGNLQYEEFYNISTNKSLLLNY